MQAKTCVRCKLSKSTDDFYRASNTKDGLRVWCKECHKRSASESRKRLGYTPEESRRKRLKRLYKLTEKQWEEIFERQGRRCAICKCEEPKRYWTVDHDHSCCSGKKSCGECVRGILCELCNQGLGQFKDSQALIRRALTYLEEKSNVA